MSHNNNTPTSSIDYSKCDSIALEIIDSMIEYFGESERDYVTDIIWHTYIFARDAHHNQLRKSGEPYITHPLEAAKLLIRLKPDLVTVQSCILHDVIEDTERSQDDIEKNFGKDVAEICQ